MKKVKYSIGISGFVLAMSLAFLISYNSTVSNYEKQKQEQEQELAESETQIQAVDNVGEDTVTNRTSYILESYDVKTDSLEQETLPTPAVFIGLTRSELIEYLKEYEAAPTTEDVKNGFVKFVLVSFSSDTIVLRKSYEIQYSYYLIEEDGLVTVYKEDRKTIYEYTDIRVSTLPTALQEEIKAGKYMQDNHELYNFLENYSS